MVFTPEKAYSVTRDLRVALTPEAKKAGEGVYEIYNEKTKEAYVGMSTDIPKRLISHASSWRTGAKNPLAEAVRRNPDLFKVRLYPSKRKKLSTLEQRLIEKRDSIKTGYNRRQGGGGGTSHALGPLPTSTCDPKTTTPQKYYPIKRVGKRLKIEWTPSMKKANGVYMFTHKVKGTLLIGETGRTFSHRFSEYSTAFNRPGTAKGDLPLARAVRESPDKVMAAVYPGALPGDEARFIAEKKPSLNQNGGSGGPRPARRLF